MFKLTHDLITPDVEKLELYNRGFWESLGFVLAGVLRPDHISAIMADV